QDDAVNGKPAAVRQIDDAEAAQELDGCVSTERDKSPEHQGVREAGTRPLDDGLSLTDDVDEKPCEAEPEVVEGERIGCCGNQARARRDLRGKRADENDHEQPEQQGGHTREIRLKPDTTTQLKPDTPRSG